MKYKYENQQQRTQKRKMQKANKEFKTKYNKKPNQAQFYISV